MAERRNRLVLTGVVLLAIAAACFWFWPDEPLLVNSSPEAPPVPVAVAPAASAPIADAGVLDRSAVPIAAPAAPAAPDPMLAHVRGRCVDENGAPLAGCTAKFDAWGGNSDRMALQGKVEWKTPEPIVTSDDGRFDFAFAPPSGMQFSLDVKGDDRVPRTGRWGELKPAQVVDLGDIALQRGFPVRGRVVDETGAPLAKVGVSLQNLPLPIAPGMGANDSRYGFSAANGEFLINAAIPLGTWSLAVQSRGMRLVSPDRVTVTERGAEPLLVTVRSMPSIQGLVVDELGQPVKGVEIRAELNRSGRTASGSSRADGTFTIFAVDAEPKPVKLRIGDPGPCEPPAAVDDRLWEWGSRDVRIELRRALSGELVVVERVSGAPVTQFAVSCYGQSRTSSPQDDLRLGGEHPEGRVTMDHIWRGKNFLQVMPIDPALLPSAIVEFEATDAGVPPQRIEVDRLASATVRVTTANGTPIKGSKVEVIVQGTDAFAADSWAQETRSGSRSRSSDPKQRFHELISEAVTGADGVAAVFVPSSGTGLVVRATGEHPPTIVDPAQFVLGQDLVIVPLAAGSIVGVVRLNGLDASLIRIARHFGEAGPRTNFEKETALQADGTFALRGLVPGPYQLRLSYSVPYRTEHSGSSGRSPLGVPNVEVVVEAEREAVVDIDATAIAPGSVRGRVLLDGAPASPARVFLRADRGATYGQFVPGADGAFEAPGLLPGKYRVGLVVGDFQAGEGDTILQDEEFQLADGQQLVSDFAFVRRRLVITLLQADGKTPAVNVLCILIGEGLMMRDKATDQDGKLVIDPAPAGPMRIQAAGSRSALGPVQIPVGQTSHAVTLTLPKVEGK